MEKESLSKDNALPDQLESGEKLKRTLDIVEIEESLKKTKKLKSNDPDQIQLSLNDEEIGVSKTCCLTSDNGAIEVTLKEIKKPPISFSINKILAKSTGPIASTSSTISENSSYLYYGEPLIKSSCGTLPYFPLVISCNPSSTNFSERSLSLGKSQSPKEVLPHNIDVILSCNQQESADKNSTINICDSSTLSRLNNQTEPVLVISSLQCPNNEPPAEQISTAPFWFNLNQPKVGPTFVVKDCVGTEVYPRRIGHPYQNRNPPKRKKPRTSFSRIQICELEKRFLRQKYLASSERANMAHSLKMSDAQVKTWFQNRRTKWRRQTAEERELERQATNKLLLSLQKSSNLDKSFFQTTSSHLPISLDSVIEDSKCPKETPKLNPKKGENQGETRDANSPQSEQDHLSSSAAYTADCSSSRSHSTPSSCDSPGPEGGGLLKIQQFCAGKLTQISEEIVACNPELTEPIIINHHQYRVNSANHKQSTPCSSTSEVKQQITNASGGAELLATRSLWSYDNQEQSAKLNDVAPSCNSFLGGAIVRSSWLYGPNSYFSAQPSLLSTGGSGGSGYIPNDLLPNDFANPYRPHPYYPGYYAYPPILYDWDLSHRID